MKRNQLRCMPRFLAWILMGQVVLSVLNLKGSLTYRRLFVSCFCETLRAVICSSSFWATSHGHWCVGEKGCPFWNLAMLLFIKTNRKLAGFGPQCGLSWTWLHPSYLCFEPSWMLDGLMIFVLLIHPLLAMGFVTEKVSGRLSRLLVLRVRDGDSDLRTPLMPGAMLQKLVGSRSSANHSVMVAMQKFAKMNMSITFLMKVSITVFSTKSLMRCWIPMTGQ